MKSGTEAKVKFLSLMSKSGMPRWQVRGLLDSLWQFTATNCPRGDIGKYSDAEIALGIDWRDDPAQLVQMLVETRWIDAHDEYRLVVHDWSEHCEDTVHRAMARAKLYFADGSAPKLTRLERHEREEAERFYAQKKTRSAACVPRASRDARRAPADAAGRLDTHGVHPSPARPGPAKPSLAKARPGPAGTKPEPAPGPEPRQGDADSQHEPLAETPPDRTGACAAGVAGGAPAPEPEPDSTPPPRGAHRTGPTEAAARDGATAPPKSHGRLLARIDAARLRDTAWLMAWVADASGADPPLVSDCDADRLRVLGVAERALEAGDDPPKLFVSLVRRRDWEHVTQAQEDRAARRYREYQDARRGDGARRAALASQLASIGKLNGTEAQHAKAISGAR